MLYAFICPIGYGLVNLDEQEADIRWTKFSGTHQEQAEQFYQISFSQDYQNFKEFLPINKEIGIDQRSLWEYIHRDETNEFNITYIQVTQDIRHKIFNNFTLEEKTELDKITKLLSSLTIQKIQSRDVYISQAINAIDDLTAQINLIHNRLVEWYGVHFPELGDYIKDISQFFRLVNQIGNRDSIWPNLNLSERKLARLTEFAQESLGSHITADDLRPIQELARLGSRLIKSRKELEEYIENAVMIILPNVTRLTGALIAARLLSHAGSLEALSKFPSSTIQLLGAEKALFRHLKTGERPPKHGIIFQSPYIHQAPFHQRGRRARVLAGKISIASRLDYFIGEDQGTQLEDDVEKRINYIAEKFAKPPKRKKVKKPDSRDRTRKRKKEKYQKGKKKFRGDSRGGRK